MLDIYNDFKEKERIAKIVSLISEELCDRNRKIKIMEICGGHTHSIMKYGLNKMLNDSVDFIHGPGCPVCVMPIARIDIAIYLSRLENVILATYGDMMRVPGSKSSLIKERGNGSNIRIIYSPIDIIKLAKDNENKKIIFYAIGFETTAPMTAALIEQAKIEGIKNIYFYINHVLVPPPIEAILDSCDSEIDGFIGPGHVSVITGTEIYKNIADKYKKPIVISGFEPFDLLISILMITKQINGGFSKIEIGYKRAVEEKGNKKAQDLINKYFEVRDNFEWRGLGYILKSALKLKDKFKNIDAERLFEGYISKNLNNNNQYNNKIIENETCKCGEILKGTLKPNKCPLFRKLCTPENPVGACMVSQEGACAAYYKYYN